MNAQSALRKKNHHSGPEAALVVTGAILPAALKEHDAARYIGMSVAFLRQTRSQGNRAGRTPGPAYRKVGRAIVYLRADLDKWLEQGRIEHAAPEARE